ncbi:tripartite tricarboxylate transporter TctB family protein [Vreelandella sp. EE22]
MRPIRDFAFDWIAWALFACVPIAIFWNSATSLAEQGVASGGPMQNAAMFPRGVAVIMTVLLVLNAARTALGRVSHPSAMTRSEGTLKAVSCTALFIAYLIFLPTLGFHLATPVLTAILFRLFGIGLVGAITGGVALSLATAFIFEGVLNVVLPVGVFEITIFT